MSNHIALQLGVVAYAVAALAFLALTILIKPGVWHWQSPAMRLWVASAASFLWSVVSVLHATRDAITDAGLYFIDLLQLCVWLWALSSIAKLQSLPARWLRFASASAICAPLLATFLLASTFGAPAPNATSYGLVLTGLLISLLGVLAIEQIYRNASTSTQDALRWMSLGIGGVFVVNLFVFAQAVLTHAFNTEVWAVRGLLFAALAVPIAVGTRRLDQRWANSMFVSRQVVFYTTSFMLVGAYLVLMSLGGFYLRSSGGAWGRPAEVFFLTIAALLLAVLIFSGTVRRRLMVWLTKSFYRNRYDYRAEWLRFIKTLSEKSAHQSIQETAIVSVAQIIDSGRGALWVRNDAGDQFLPAASWPEQSAMASLPQLQAGEGLASFIARTGWVVDLRELVVRPALYDDLRVDAGVAEFDREAIILPLLHREQMYGLLALARPQGLEQLNFEDRDLLKTVGRHLAAHLSQDDNDRRLAESSQFEAYNRLTAFVMHDLKNLTAQLQLVVHNAERHKRNPEFVDDAIATIANSVDRMGKLLSQLTRGSAAEHRREVDLSEIVQRVVLRAANREPAPEPVVAAAPSVQADPERLAMVLDHVIRNAQDATQPDGHVRVELDALGAVARIRITDDGSGMEESFIRERLFRPFDTTKGSKGMGIGAYQAREYMRSLGGDVVVTSAPGKGTCFTLQFPVHQPATAPTA